MFLNFSFVTVFLKNRNIISKIKRSKVTDYAALRQVLLYLLFFSVVTENFGNIISVCVEVLHDVCRVPVDEEASIQLE